MPLTKDGIKYTLGAISHPAGGTLADHDAMLWSSVCDTYASVKLELPAGATREQFDRVSAVAKQSMDAYALREGTKLDSFIIEYVDKNGTVVHTARFGGMPGASAASASQPATPSASIQSSPQGSQAPKPSAASGHTPIPGLKQPERAVNARHIIAVGAGKGGVGKSTVSLNIAVGLARRGFSVGLLDGDIYGPSMPTMLNLASLDAVVHRGMLQPFLTHGIKAMTIGKLVDPDKPLIWRGPMAHGAFKQLTEQTEWGELDYLIIDLPPGTGDVSLTMAQTLQLTGAVVICTPQKVAQDDAVRAAKMFQQLQIPILGVVENMSAFIGDDGKQYDIFGKGGAEVMAQKLNVPFLGALPITMSLRRNSDAGDPTSNFTPAKDDVAGQRLTKAFEDLITNLEGQVALTSVRGGSTKPTLTIS
ncbi:MAG: Mrp/NBP35 family ATP-binding protein [Phycisphaerae bacterium]|jgi:ATP-binding protein involved in chromosome partitioning